MKTDGTLALIRPQPSPCHRIEDPELVETMRRIDCRFYDRCLFLAAERGWRGFHCKDCAAYKAPSPADQRRDYIGALTLLAETQLLPSLLLADVVTDEQEGAKDS